MKIQINTSARWTFTYPDVPPCQTEVSLSKGCDGKFSFSIPFGSKRLVVALDTSWALKKNPTISASYLIEENNLKGKVTFQVSSDGKKLIGSPTNFHDPQKWLLECC
ncbi:MAG: hypothetical protein H7A36_05915 [Chlamydiales bacterium]|nr:hypothetical protein [Chlamydiales bacterium]